jgi:glycosyltransferase involved in cell wall biosynthesis
MSKHIWLVPIEPITERYTEQWYRRFPETFKRVGFSVTTIDGVPLLENEIKVGAFLDINSTVHYKMSQLQAIAKLFHNGQIKNGDIFFFGDIEFWGLESVRLMAQMNKVDVKITGFLHAASYTQEDAFAIAAPYQQFTEVGWLAALDKVFVGSLYHKQAFVTRRLGSKGDALSDKIVVTSNPLFIDEYPSFDVPKHKKVLLTNRFDHEKRPAKTLKLFTKLKAAFPDWEFVVTTGRPHIRGSNDDMLALNEAVSKGVVIVKAGLTKDQYHRELAEAYMMVSHSIEENYGYCVAEAIHYGCIPIVTRGLSHDELVTPTYQFEYHASPGYDASDFDVAAKWMQRFNNGAPTMKLDLSGMQNIINELLDL